MGGDAPISVQSMTNTDTLDYEQTCDQICRLASAGAEIIRLAFPTIESCRLIGKFKQRFGDLPLIADIHFDYKIAIQAIKEGIDCVRVNPGNLGSIQRLKQVAECARDYGATMRVGVNSGSVSKSMRIKYNGPTAEALAASAQEYALFLENMGFNNFKISLKSSSIFDTINSFKILAKNVDCPFHIGLTSAGPRHQGSIRNSITLGSLLMDGIGDTVRVSLTADPVWEIKVARSILLALELRPGLTVVSCPTCGRCQDQNLLIEMAEWLEEKVVAMSKNISFAIMGCEVNGPGEAKEADLGMALTKKGGVFFTKGKVVDKAIPLNRLKEYMLEKIEEL